METKNMKQGKVWGDTDTVFSNGHVSVHVLKIKKGGFCSEHKHKSKVNHFHVISGCLQISIWQDSSIDHVVIEDGENTIVNPGSFHKFLALEDTLALEIYYAPLDEEDIERRTKGGLAAIEKRP
jgi:mannose-6-phosphate isomerase-like protein (cupin superfamily)